MNERRGMSITPAQTETLPGGPVFTGINSYRTFAEIEDLKEVVIASGCRARGTEECCSDCAKFLTARVIELPICSLVNGTIVSNE